MVVTDRLIFLQLQKTACTHIARLLREEFAAREVDGKHRPLPREFRGGRRLIVGSVRNPWDWYVSLWAFGCTQRGGPFLRSTSERSGWSALRDPRVHRLVGWRSGAGPWLCAVVGERTRPAESWRRLHADKLSPDLFRGWLKLALDRGRRYDLFRDYGHSRLSSYAGLLTYLYELLYLRTSAVLYGRNAPADLQTLMHIDDEQNILDRTIRTEELEKGLLDALTTSGYELTDRHLQRISSGERTNESGWTLAVADYYDAETLELVAERERLIIEKYGYGGPGAAGHSEDSRAERTG